MLVIFLLAILLTNFVDSVPIRMVSNGILLNTVNTFIKMASRDECICTMMSNATTVVGFNYFQQNRTCQYFLSYNSLTELQISPGSSVIISEPSTTTELFTSTAMESTVQTTIRPTTQSFSTSTRAYWSFDNDFNDRYSVYNGKPINNVSLCSPGIAGARPALCVSSTRSQYVVINSTVPLNLSWTSFTFETWIYAYNLSNGSGSGADQGIIAQCESSNPNRCLHLTIRNSKPRMSFYSNWCEIATVLSLNTWYHLSFVYDYSQTTQTFYIDGVLSCNHSGSPPLQISTPVAVTIGYNSLLAPYYFNGRIDEVSFVSRAKSPSELLDDATLTAYYSFDAMSLADSGPNNIFATGQDLIYTNRSISFSSSTAFFQAGKFVLLGVLGRSYSISIWIRPKRIDTGATIIHLSTNINGTGSGCITLLSINGLGQLTAASATMTSSNVVTGPVLTVDTWIHACQTYSPTDGFRLYINGTQIPSFILGNDYGGFSDLAILTLGNPLEADETICSTGNIRPTTFYGDLDEFRVYSRALTANDIQSILTR